MQLFEGLDIVGRHEQYTGVEPLVRNSFANSPPLIKGMSTSVKSK